MLCGEISSGKMGPQLAWRLSFYKSSQTLIVYKSLFTLTAFYEDDPIDAQQVCHQNLTYLSRGRVTVRCDQLPFGRYFFVSIPKTQWEMSFCEVEVYPSKINSMYPVSFCKISYSSLYLCSVISIMKVKKMLIWLYCCNNDILVKFLH